MSLDIETIDKLLEEDEVKSPRTPKLKDHPWTCPKCKKWITSQTGAKFHKCKA